jgi:hypothetical protein
MTLLCFNEPAMSATSREYRHGECAANIGDHDARHKLLTKHMGCNAPDLRAVDFADHLRSKLVRETEQYLNSPHSRSWARASRTRSTGVPYVRPRMPAA